MQSRSALPLPDVPARSLAAPGLEPMTVRRANPVDASGVSRLRMLLRVEESGSILEPDEPAPSLQEEIARIAAQDRDPGLLTLVAESAGQLVGWLEFSGGEHRRTAHRGWVVLAVAAGYRRLGIGRALLEALHDWASRHRLIEQVALHCAENNAPALALYRSLGYVEEGRSRRALKLAPGRYADVVQLCRDLREGGPAVMPGPSTDRHRTGR
ncbi:MULTISPECIES: GNAT family N-acetyltransferase [Sorangium]|uniref:N-acetyltransferase domain-containing protein n=1 Tax=Sorangium cellulosum TaxID=56 RepID=A0A4P2QI63_SORCE|nr:MULTISPECIES: GNAT family N-acetyltransferase [Sorangium]AUX29288.1 uncharacterized protein SOCE836_013760 [Sorangium cellulosum]WCQ88678.1 acetyltransferase [Sorangium sp. Soce836]